MKIANRLLSGVASLTLVLPFAAQAQTVDAPTSVADDAQAAADSSEIVVLGFGQSRQVQSVSAIDMERLTPGTSPLKAVAKLDRKSVV